MTADARRRQLAVDSAVTLALQVWLSDPSTIGDDHDRLLHQVETVIRNAVTAMTVRATRARAAVADEPATAAALAVAAADVGRTALREVRWCLDRLRAHTAAEERTAAEQRRVAGELHDLGAHGLTLMVLQADVAARLAERDAVATAQALVLVDRLGTRTAMELGRLIAEQRAGTGAGGPEPCIAELVALVRGTGVPIELVLEDEGGIEPVARTAYRIVQEALTNVGRHASGAPVTVRVVDRGTAVDIEVANGPATSTSPAGDVGGGHGIAGMRERLWLLGGDLEAGPRDDGGFQVRACIPAR